MRVVYITARYPPHLGGTEIHTYEVARAMAARGHEVAVITTDRSDRLPMAESSERLEIVRVPAYPADRDYYLAPRLRRFVKHEAPDLIHVQSYHTAVAPLVLRWLSGMDVPHLLTFHSGGSSKRWRRSLRPLQYRLLRRYTSKTAALVAVSNFERDLFAARLGLAPERIDVVRNGVSTDVLTALGATKRDPNLIISAGRLEHYKGHHRVIRAMPAILRRRPDAHLLVVGSGPHEPALREQSRQLGLGDHVAFTTVEQTDRASMGCLLARATVSASLSDYEAEGIGAIESMAMGCRTVVTAGTALRELVDDDRVLGVAPGAPNSEISRVLIRALTDGAPSEPMPPRLWSHVADDLEVLYRRILCPAGR